MFWDDMRAVTATWFTVVPAIHEIRSTVWNASTGPQALPLKFVMQSGALLKMADERAMELMFGAPLLTRDDDGILHQATSGVAAAARSRTGSGLAHGSRCGSLTGRAGVSGGC